MTEIRAYANCDQTYVVWRVDERIPRCRGFALERRVDGQVEVLDSWVGFAGGRARPGTRKPTSTWPIQKFMWSDYDVPPGVEVSYRAIPMTGTAKHLRRNVSNATGWSDPVRAGTEVGSGISAYFNRGVVATQWLSRQLAALGGTQAGTLRSEIRKVTSPIRRFLGGAILVELTSLLEQALDDHREIYAALYELDDPQLIGLLGRFGPRAHVILTNGADVPDENAASRAKLKEKHVDVTDRLLANGHAGHNKFLVVCDAAGRPASVWTGSTNWTMKGLCTQANNALLLEDAAVAGWYRAEWDAIKAAGNGFPAAYVTGNDAPHSAVAGGVEERVWFTPVHDGVDLTDARARINAATQGILFLMFNPGPAGTLLNDIIERTATASPTYDADLYVHGVLNQDPSTTAHPIVGLFHRGQFSAADIDVVLPAAVSGVGAYWIDELLKLPEAFAMVHSKVVVIDPFGDKPCVITGSHNLGPHASGKNDDNLVIVEGLPALAAAYAVNVMAVYNQYRWRYRTKQHGTAGWSGLADDDHWQDTYFAGMKARELDFWLGVR